MRNAFNVWVSGFAAHSAFVAVLAGSPVIGLAFLGLAGLNAYIGFGYPKAAKALKAQPEVHP